MAMQPAALAPIAQELTKALNRHGFTTAGIAEHLGPNATAAWRRGEPAAVRRRASDDAPLSVLIRAFILGDWVEPDQLTQLIGQSAIDQLCEADGDLVRVAFDVMPHVLDGTDRWVFSDRDASMRAFVPGPDHVLGVGAASLSLLSSVPSSPVDSLLDLGTGSGVQLLAQASVAKHATGTDIHPRALDFARATLAGAGLAHVELLEGGWFTPVAGRTFDRIVANPPFVVGMPEVGHVYRDSGLNLDGASEIVVSEAAQHLTAGGTAHLLAAWAHVDGERWQQRIASWLPDTGVAAWVLQRDVADPELYVGTWLRDESIDPREPGGQDRTVAWLDHFAKFGVTGIGFGFVAIQRLADDEPSDIVIEELSQAFDDPLGPEVEEYFLRAQWLRTRQALDIATSRFALRPSVAINEVSVADESGQGTRAQVLRISRLDGPRFSHDIDEHVRAIVNGLHPAGLTLAEIADLYCAAHGFDIDAFLPEIIGIFVDLIRHGIVLPAELLAD
ncbi:class I SAM-dependent methyltransferase [Staphylococcus chromogenes]|nr:class I SAM-dependent methyltransferase [Staphylococcus chromogenes]